MNGQLVITRGDALLFLVWAASTSLVITGVVLYALISGALGTPVIFVGIAGALFAGGSLDLRAFRRLKREGRSYEMPSVRNEIWKRRTLQRALLLTVPEADSTDAVKALIALPAFAALLGVALKLWP